MIARLAAAAVALVLVIGGATACRPDPEPTPSGPVFATEDEAFAAAEETYRAYVDALNRVDLSDPETFEAVYAWTTGDANAQVRETFSQMHADGWTVSGDSRPTLVQPLVGGSNGFTQVEVAVCLDVTAVQLVDEAGESVVSADRPDVQSMLITMQATDNTTTGWTIERFDGREGEPACG
jgi:hypothetical protein